MIPLAILLATVVALVLSVALLGLASRFGGVKRFGNLILGWYVSVLLIAVLFLAENYLVGAAFLVASSICLIAMWPRGSQA